MSDKYSVKILPEINDVFWYEIYHVYAGAKGVIRICISLLFLSVGIYSIGRVGVSLTLLTLLVGLFNIAVTPVMLYVKSLKLHAMQIPTRYTFFADMVEITQGEESGIVRWSDFYHIAETKRCIILYTDLAHAFLLPCAQLDEDERDRIKNHIIKK